MEQPRKQIAKEDIALKLWRMKDLSTFTYFTSKKPDCNEKSMTYQKTKEAEKNRSVSPFIDKNTDKIIDKCSDDDDKKSDSKPDLSDHENEGKPGQSYISLIANAILSSRDKQLVLSDIYAYIMEKHPYFQKQDKSWRNSVRHNLSLNECFIKAGRSDQGKGHFWAIHPANYDDFSKGDFRRRRARKRVKRSFFNSTSYASYSPYNFDKYYPPRVYQNSLQYMNDFIRTPLVNENKNNWKSERLDYSFGYLENKGVQNNPTKRKPTLFTIDSILGRKPENNGCHGDDVTNKKQCRCRVSC